MLRQNVDSNQNNKILTCNMLEMKYFLVLLQRWDCLFSIIFLRLNEYISSIFLQFWNLPKCHRYHCTMVFSTLNNLLLFFLSFLQTRKLSQALQARLWNHKSNIEEPSCYLISLTRKTANNCNPNNKSTRLCAQFTSKRKTSFNGIDDFMTFLHCVIWGT